MGSPGCSEATIDQCGCCLTYSPIVLDLAGDGVRMSSGAEGALFDINGLGRIMWVAWPVGEDDGWLALDRNGNGVIDDGSELFGNTTRLRSGKAAQNGYEALAELDENGDGIVDTHDPQFANLQIWIDADHNGRVGSGELRTLSTTRILGLSTTAKESRRRDAFGNEFRLRAPVNTLDESHQRYSYDVWPDVQPVTGVMFTTKTCALQQKQ